MPAAKYYTHDGQTLTLAGWSKRLGINKRTLNSRLKYGWPLDRVFSHEPIEDLKLIRLSAEQIFRAWARSPAPKS